MIELQHRPTPTPALTQYNANNPNATVADFGSDRFRPVKQLVKTDLNSDQGGLCVYCEKKLAATEGQVEHIKPKSGPNGHPHLCFTYSNYAHSCINEKSCGQKKKDGLLPITPGPNCNDRWKLSITGYIEPISGLTRREKHEVTKTRDMLGLNKDTNLIAEREKWLEQTLVVIKELQDHPHTIQEFLAQIPYRYIITASIWK